MSFLCQEVLQDSNKTHLSANLSIFQFIHPSVCLSMSLYPSTGVQTPLSVFLYCLIDTFVFWPPPNLLEICIYLSRPLLPLSLYKSFFLYLSVFLSIQFSLASLSIQSSLYIPLSLYSSIYILYLCTSVNPPLSPSVVSFLSIHLSSAPCNLSFPTSIYQSIRVSLWSLAITRPPTNPFIPNSVHLSIFSFLLVYSSTRMTPLIPLLHSQTGRIFPSVHQAPFSSTKKGI